MKQLRLLAIALTVLAWATAASACDDKPTNASASKECCGASGKTATAANMKAGAACSMKGTKATAANAQACAMHGTKTAATAAAAGSDECCMGKSATTATASKMSAKDCPMHGASTAGCPMTAGSTAACPMHGTATTTAANAKCDMHSKMASHTADCAACSDLSICDDDVRATGAHQQVVALKNGAMIVYTAEKSDNVRALQAAVARHNETVMAAYKGDAKLCTDCKQLRGALASGKMNREVINTNGGCQVLMTSSDRNIVERIHGMTAGQMAVRVKS